MRRQALAAAVLVLAACATTQPASTTPAPIRKVVPAGVERKVRFYWSVSPACTSQGEIVVRVTDGPSHGTVRVTPGEDYSEFPTSNLRSVCNTHALPSTQVWYKSADGFIGTDELRLDVLFPYGTERQDTVVITVK
jgi:hypothetical protein